MPPTRCSSICRAASVAHREASQLWTETRFRRCRTLALRRTLCLARDAGTNEGWRAAPLRLRHWPGQCHRNRLGLAVTGNSELIYLTHELIAGVYTVTDNRCIRHTGSSSSSTACRSNPRQPRVFLARPHGTRRRQGIFGFGVPTKATVTHLCWTTGGAFVPTTRNTKTSINADAPTAGTAVKSRETFQEEPP